MSLKYEPFLFKTIKDTEETVIIPINIENKTPGPIARNKGSAMNVAIAAKICLIKLFKATPVAPFPGKVSTRYVTVAPMTNIEAKPKIAVPIKGTSQNSPYFNVQPKIRQAGGKRIIAVTIFHEILDSGTNSPLWDLAYVRKR